MKKERLATVILFYFKYIAVHTLFLIHSFNLSEEYIAILMRFEWHRMDLLVISTPVRGMYAVFGRASCNLISRGEANCSEVEVTSELEFLLQFNGSSNLSLLSSQPLIRSLEARASTSTLRPLPPSTSPPYPSPTNTNIPNPPILPSLHQPPRPSNQILDRMEIPWT